MKTDNFMTSSKRGLFVYFRGKPGAGNVILSKRRIRQLALWLNRILRRRRGIRRVDLTMEYEISEYRFMVMEQAFVPSDAEHCSLAVLRPKIQELRTMVHPRDQLRPETYRILYGKILYSDRGYFSDLDVFTLEPLLNDGENALQCRDIAGLEEVILTQCKFRTVAGEILALYGSDAIHMIGEMKQTLLANSELFSAKFRFRINTMKKAQTLKIKLGNRAEFPLRYEKAVETWLMARGFKHGSR